MKRYAVCGVSKRAIKMFIQPLIKKFSHNSKVVGLLDIDPLRMEICKEDYPELESVPCYMPEQFEQMIRDTKPNALIVAGRDDTHIDYILKGLAHHLNIITEKPMVTTAEDAAKVMEAEKKGKGRVIVTFNYRYSPYHRKIKELMLEGKVGRVTSVDLNWYIDTYHGASYFKRWNRKRENSGGLSVHKSTHHFDLVNWWIDQIPEEVFAYGALNYYGPDGELNPDPSTDGRFCGTCEVRHNCQYYVRWDPSVYSVEDDHVSIDIRPEHYTGYRPDACIFDSEINIEDTYTAAVKYNKGAFLSYSINFSAPFEGYRLAINGTKGRIETQEWHAPKRVPFEVPSQTIVYYPLFGSKEVIHVVQTPGGHGGGDPLLINDLFSDSPPKRPYEILAGSEAGAYSIALGEGVWRSVKEHRPITIKELLQT